MTDLFLTFQSFTDPIIAQEIAEGIKAHDIPFQFENTSSPIDPVIIGSPLEADIRLKVRQQDFEKVTAILEDYFNEQIEEVDKEYYLFSFTDAELSDILQKPDEWGSFDYSLAQKLLKDRGKEVSAEALASYKTARMEEIAKPQHAGRSWIILGYFISIVFSPLGIFFGSAILSLKKTLPNGQRCYSYSESDRKHARRILTISSALTTVWVLFKVLSAKQE